jgi:hypothetical protein
MAAPAAIPLAIGLGAAGAGLSAYQASQQNRAIGQSMQSQAQATAATQQQVVDQGAIEKRKRIMEAQRIRGVIRASRGEAGIGTSGGTFGALIRQADIDAATNLGILNRNLMNNLASVRAGYHANIASLKAQTQNPLLSAFIGGLRGASAGLAIGTGLASLGATGAAASAAQGAAGAGGAAGAKAAAQGMTTAIF